jgi:hypothetical protein
MDTPVAESTAQAMAPQRVWLTVAKRYSWAPFVSIAVIYLLLDIRAFGWHPADWDLLLLSAWSTAAVGAAMAQTIPRHMHHAVERLVNRGTLGLSPRSLPAFVRDLEGWASRVARRVALVLALLMFGAFVRANRGHALDIHFALYTVISVLGTYGAGLYLGRMTAYGGLGRYLGRNSVSLNVRAEHADATGGA